LSGGRVRVCHSRSAIRRVGAAFVLVSSVIVWGPALAPGPAAASSSAPSRFVAVTPTRVLDTRYGTGGVSGAVGALQSISVGVAGAGRPAPAGATAVVMNVTAVGPTAPSYVTVFPTGTSRPTVSNLNLDAGRTAPNLVTVRVGSGGEVSLYNRSGSVHLAADLFGYYVDDGGESGYVPLTPARLLDTRNGTGRSGRLGPADSFDLGVAGGTSPVPAEASAVALNVTAVAPTAGTYVSAFPAGSPRPVVSNLNVGPGDVRANLAIVAVGSGGRLTFFNAAGTVHLVADVVGYYARSGSGLLDFVAVDPFRLSDTRVAGGAIAAGATRKVGAGGVDPVPADARAVVVNTTVTGPTTAGYLSVYAENAAQPATSSVNFVAGQTVPNLVVTELAPSGRLAQFNAAGSTHVVSDVAGYFTDGSDPVLVGAGDIAECGHNRDEETATLLDGIRGTVFTTGDNTYPVGAPADFSNCYEPSWGRHRVRTRPAPGNHDYATSQGAPYYDYFGSVAAGPSGWYSYDLGTWHVVVLNSNCSVVSCTAGSPQETWLRADLAAHPAECTIAMWHHPRFSSGGHGDQVAVQPLWQALYDSGVEVVLNGHDHDYERFEPLDDTGSPDAAHGIREFVVGTGGASHGAISSVRAGSAIHEEHVYGVLKLTLHDSSYEWQFTAVPGFAFTDAGTSACH